MYDLKELTAEIVRKIERMRELNNDVLNPSWITKAVLCDHESIDGEDTGFFIYNAQTNVRNEIRKYINKFKINAEDNQQMVLPGLVRVQQYYLVPRDGEQCAVHVHMLTPEEVDAKCKELHAMSVGCLEHADELRRYWETRRAA